MSYKKLQLLLCVVFSSLALSSCGKDDEPDQSATLSKKSYELFHDEKAHVEGTNLEGLTWNSGNDFVARVDKGIISAYYVGETTVKSGTGNLSFKVTVKPQYNLYQEPHMDWGMSMSTFKSKYGQPASSTETVLLYNTNNTKVPYAMYLFENDKLKSSSVVVKTTYADELANFLEERYMPIDVNTSKLTATFVHVFGSNDNPQIDYGVSMSYSSQIGGMLVLYLPYSSSNNTRGGDLLDTFKYYESEFYKMNL